MTFTLSRTAMGPLLLLLGACGLLAVLVALQPLSALVLPAILVAGWIAWDARRCLLVLAYSPLYYFPLVALGVPGIWKDAVIGLLILTSVVRWIRGGIPAGIRGPLGFVGIFGTYLLFEFIRSPAVGPALGGFRDYFEFLLVLPVSLTFLRDRHEATWLLRHLFIAGLLVSLYGGFEYFTGARMPASVDLTAADGFKQGRIYSSLGYPTSLGAFLFLLIIIGQAGALSRDATLPTRWLQALVLLFLAVLVVSFARGATVATVLALGLVFALQPGRLRTRVSIAVCIFLLGVTGVLLVPNIRALLSTINLQDAALLERFLIWQGIMGKLLESNLVLGAGLGIVSGAYAHQARLVSDNFLLKILLELGVVGLALSVGFHLYLLGRFFRKLRRALGAQRQALVAGIGVIVGVFVIAFSMDIGLVFPLNFLYWLCLACLIRYADA